MNPKQAMELKTEDKRIWLNGQFTLAKKAVGRIIGFQRNDALMLLIERRNLLRDSFEQFKTRTDLDLRKDIKIHFIDELCQDAGGLIREWFTMLIKELFKPKFGLFARTKTGQVAYTINIQSSKCCVNHLEYFFFCGQVLAKALFENIPLKAYLCRPLFRTLAGMKVEMEDLKYLDEELWQTIEFIRENKIEGDVGSFAVSQMDPVDKKPTIIELKENGSKTLIAEENKHEFIKLFCKFYLKDSIESQFESLAEGFLSLIPKKVVQVLDADELELFLCGDAKLSLEDWRANTKYTGVYNDNHEVIKWFWEVLSQLSLYELERFLQFCTGSNRIPAEGFSGLTSNNGKRCRFVIDSKSHKGDGTDFPIAHTCFNKIELPMYNCRKEMQRVIKQIIHTPMCYQFSFE
eukprot:TRINITY_DN5669_c0_g2_i3.p1 TRINITY_DN5669_c0_g2~~TRINITY_DN5669_c0_g2_i3.p1  ORF type:complete len:405 (+),score=69.53 TRINITY_DN5669_c0_g2_i3:749-1963(+)